MSFDSWIQPEAYTPRGIIVSRMQATEYGLREVRARQGFHVLKGL